MITILKHILNRRKLSLPVFVFLLTLIGCGGSSNKLTKGQFKTERLYALSGKDLTLSHATSNDGAVTPQGGAVTLGEQLTYSEEVKEDPLPIIGADELANAALDTNRVYTLSQVTVTSKARFTPIREGSVQLDFAIRIPKEYLSDDYRITVTPELIYGDSIVKLADVLLRGKNFIRMQEEDYKRYEEYLASIVDSTDYLNAFVDYGGIEMELEQRRAAALVEYQAKWALVTEYWDWRNRTEDEFILYNDHAQQLERQKLAAARREYLLERQRKFAAGGDTIPLWKKYQRKCESIRRSTPVKREITLAAVPQKYRQIYMANLKPEDVAAQMPGARDSLGLIDNYLMTEEIRANELRQARKDAVFRKMVPYPYREDAQHSATIVPAYNFNYRYSTVRTVNAGQKNFRLTLKGQILATDRSVYHFNETDTLTFVISSLDELADRSLVNNAAFTAEQRSDYAQALKFLRDREYAAALRILNEFTDYNTVLALTCLGYNEQAYGLVVQLPKTGDTEYLAAILARRLKQKQQAAEHLSQAFTLDPDKRFRAPKDPEITALMKEFKFIEN